MKKAQIILKSESIFTAVASNPINGYLALNGNEIIRVSTEEIDKTLLDRNTKIYDLGNKTICPGFIDAHVFFSGWALRFIGVNLKNAANTNEIINLISNYERQLNNDKPIWGHGYKIEIDAELINLLNVKYYNRPIVIFSKDAETFWLNKYAESYYGFDLDADCNEVFWRLIEEILDDYNFIKPLFKQYMAMLNSCGITMVKEIGYDTFSSFPKIFEELENDNEMNIRVNFMSQPVKSGANFSYAKKMRDKFKKEFVRFSGFNRMTDGSIGQMNGYLKQPYNNTNIYCNVNIDWETIENEVKKADEENFRFSLNAQGNASVENIVKIFSSCKKDSAGKLINRHAITEAEYADPIDIKEMGNLGIICEFYPQIQAITSYEEKTNMIKDKIGLERGKNYWNRKIMNDFKIPLCCGTDLPLVIDNIPQSIFYTVTGKFPDSDKSFNENNTLTIDKVLKAWTLGGAYDMYREIELGSLEEGKLADIAVFDTNIFNTPIDDICSVKICMTLVNGKIVYNNI